MEPPVLVGVFADKLLNRVAVFLGNPCQGVVLVGPFFGHDYAVDADFKEESIADSPAVAYSYRYIVGDCEQAYALVCAGLSAHEFDEYSFSAGILVGNEAEGRAGRCDFRHQLGGSFFVDYLLPDPLSQAVEVFA